MIYLTLIHSVGLSSYCHNFFLGEPKRVTLSAINLITGFAVSFHKDNPSVTFLVTEGQPINISCRSDDAEPIATHDVTINGTRVNVTTFVIPNGEFYDTESTWLLREPLYRELHGADIDCLAANAVNPIGIKGHATIIVLGKELKGCFEPLRH